MKLPELAGIVAEWADQRPIVKHVFIFGSQVRGDAGSDSDVDLFIRWNYPPETEAVRDWVDENSNGFPDLASRIPIKLSIHTDLADAAWPKIRAAAGDPVLIAGKVTCCATPKKPL